MNFIRVSREGWLLYSGVLLLLLGTALLFINGSQEYYGSRTFEGISLSMFIIFAIIFAPILEEFAFRGNFSRKRIIRLIAFIALPLLIISSGADWISYVWLVVFYVMYFLSKWRFNNKLFLNFTLISSAILFGVVHYKVSDFTDFNTAFFVVFQIGAGLIFNWVMLNYGLLKSVLAHSLYNFIAIVPIFISLQYPNAYPRYFENDNIKVEWQKVPAMNNSDVNYTSTKGMINATNIEGAMLYKFVKTDSASQRKITVNEQWSKFNFKIVLKDTTANVKIEDEAKRFLENEMFEMLENDND